MSWFFFCSFGRRDWACACVYGRSFAPAPPRAERLEWIWFRKKEHGRGRAQHSNWRWNTRERGFGGGEGCDLSEPPAMARPPSLAGSVPSPPLEEEGPYHRWRHVDRWEKKDERGQGRGNRRVVINRFPGGGWRRRKPFFFFGAALRGRSGCYIGHAEVLVLLCGQTESGHVFGSDKQSSIQYRVFFLDGTGMGSLCCGFTLDRYAEPHTSTVVGSPCFGLLGSCAVYSVGGGARLLGIRGRRPSPRPPSLRF